MPGRGGGWIDEFHDQLEKWLKNRRQLDGLRVWRDRELHGNTDFDIAIANKIDSVALFLVLHSRAQRNSEYCAKELDWFSDKYHDHMLVGEQRRIFNVLLNNIPQDDWHKALEGATGFIMHDAEGEELGDFTDPKDGQYGSQLREVVDAAETTLNAMRAQQQAARPDLVPNTTAAAGQLPTLFLACVSETQETTRERLITEIGDSARLLTEIPPPHEHAPHREQVEAALQQADLSIHLLDDDPGDRILDLKQTTYPRVQVEIALAQPLHQLIWLPPELSIESIKNPDYRRLLEQLDRGDCGKGGIELLRCEPTELYSLVLARLAEAAAPAAAGNAARFLIDTHQKDQRYAWRLADLLADRAADVDVNKESQDPTKSLDLFRDAVRQAQNLVILFGQVDTPWLSNRITEALKVIGSQLAVGETRVLQRLWVLLLPGCAGLPDLGLPPLIQLTPLDNRDSDAIDPDKVASLLNPAADGGEQ